MFDFIGSMVLARLGAANYEKIRFLHVFSTSVPRYAISLAPQSPSATKVG